ncbi:exosortase/archaeosortase family protein [Pelagicoccus sp. SDUM812002]|uniref:exosortase/archaeosortase family protein n=1 Tax=Pelagicoccus sp. SDUM812002 TaxID=3041266 RepID=UPI00280D66B4|nr:exosortase/archaeosortase family protein [Pelagicoccus sp. SDUM812002]MDQ8188184.1 exosortase/archaeosortase family protein [Pelagicoccus sp. SDUM812002]
MNKGLIGNAITLLAMAVAWGQLLWFLHYNWSSESSYNYGWVVPPLALLLLVPRLREASERPKAPNTSLGLNWSFIAIGLLEFVFSRVLIEVNPFWRLPLWSGACSLIFATWAWIRLRWGLAAGRASIFPLCFSLTMVPWPSMVEKHIINALTELVTRVSVEALQIIGHPAERMGNIIQMGSVTVGVEEACSGIKSLQALSMIALFVGAYWGLKVSGRSLLLLAAICLTLLFNLGRSITLSLLVVNGGQEVFDQWHDTVGYIALGLGLICLFYLGSKLPVAENPAPSEPKGSPRNWNSLARGPASLALVFALVPFFVSELWYRDLAELEDSKRIDWTVDLYGVATPNLQTETLPIHPRIEDILGFDYGHHLSIKEVEQERPAELWYYGFTGESKSKSLMAYGHSPTICMTASGALMQSRLEPLRVDLGALEIPFQHYSFRLPNGQMSQVFWCLWDDLHRGETESVDGASRLAQFKSVFSRQRSLQRKVALLGVPVNDPEQGRLIATKLVRDLFLLKQGDKTFRYK